MPSELAGSITAVPVVSMQSFERRSPFVVPEDGKNLNRSFPGTYDGTYTDALARGIFDELIAPADVLIDLHGGDLVEALEPFTIYGRGPGRGAGALARRGVRPPVRRAPGAERRTRRHDHPTRRRGGSAGDHRRGRRLRPARGGGGGDARRGRPQRAPVARDAARPGDAAEAGDAARRSVRLAALPRSRLVGGGGRRGRRGCRRRATRPRQEPLRRRVRRRSTRHATASSSSSPRARRSPTTACCSALARSSPPFVECVGGSSSVGSGRPTSEARAYNLRGPKSAARIGGDAAPATRG